MPKKFFKVDLVPALKRLEVLSKGLTSSRMTGAYKSFFKGRGLEFSDYRTYAPEDDASLIDWKASVRADKILIKQYIEERDIDVFFILDCSSRMLFGSTNKLKAEYNIELVASLAYSIIGAGDNVGVTLYSDKPNAKISPSRGTDQFYKISKILLNLDFYGGIFDLENAVNFVFSYLKKTGVVIIISDFINWKDAWENSLKLLGQKFDVICIMVRDPHDRTLPVDVGQVVISDPNSNKTLLIEPKLIKEAYEHEVIEQEKTIRNFLFRSGIDFINISTDKSFVKPIMSLFIKRALRWK